MRRPHLSRLLLAASLLSTATLLAPAAEAVGTRRFVLDTLETLQGGDLKGVSIASDGTVRAGWTLGSVPVPDASSVWSALRLADGSLLLGTASDGKIFRVAGGKVSVAVETGEMGVSALALAWDGNVVAGTFPGGKIFRFAPNVPDNTKPAAAFVTLPGTEDVWALAFDAKGKALYAATGAEGKLFRIDADGKTEVTFDSEESHLVSLAIDTDGSLYAGSNGKGLLFHISGPGRARLVHDFDADDVKGIALAGVAGKRTIYAIANTYSGAQKGLPPPKAASPGGAGPTQNRPNQAGKGQLYRFDASGAAEKMMSHDDVHYVSVAVDPTGAPFVGAGAEGRVYTVDDNHVVRLLADTEERQVGALLLDGPKRYLVTSDPVVLHEITGTGGAEAIWTSKVLDAGVRAHFGLLDWRVTGRVELETRSGNSEAPDPTWGAWSKPYAAPAKITSEPARYLQVRARWAADPTAVLEDVRVAFVTDNLPVIVTSVTVGESGTEAGGDKIPESGSPLESASSSIKIRWKVENPDNDKLRYYVLARRLGDTEWRTLTDPNEALTKTDYSWETTGVPEARYVVRVDATDELANPPDRARRHSLESRPFEVDTRAPVFEQLRLVGKRLSATVTDGLGPVARVEVALLGSKTWLPLWPVDAVFDQPTERFDAELGSIIPAGRQELVVRAYDRAGNSVTQTVSTTGP